MNKQFIKDAFGWGIILWLIGFVLGIILYPFVSIAVIGWIIMPIGIVITLWVLFKKVNPVKSLPGQGAAGPQFNRVKAGDFQFYFKIALIWTAIAVVFDYIFLVKVFKPEDGYYKFDVYLYYALIFLLPLAVAWIKKYRLKIPSSSPANQNPLQ